MAFLWNCLTKGSAVGAPALLKASASIKFSSALERVRPVCAYEKKQFERYSRHTEELLAEERKEGKIEGKIDVARHMIQDGFSMDYVSKYTGVSSEDLKTIK